MIGATLYLVGREVETGNYVANANPCSMCKRLIINSGIDTVIIRDDRENYRVIQVSDEWIANDESLEGVFGY